MLSHFLSSQYKLNFIFFEKKGRGGRSPASRAKLIPAMLTLLPGCNIPCSSAWMGPAGLFYLFIFLVVLKGRKDGSSSREGPSFVGAGTADWSQGVINPTGWAALLMELISGGEGWLCVPLGPG